ncbi:MAG TPA: hypothetical protein VG826_29095 [Pirellulales bacterium]|nr:hypothetical protein [Pirellulales bacterium]
MDVTENEERAALKRERTFQLHFLWLRAFKARLEERRGEADRIRGLIRAELPRCPYVLMRLRTTDDRRVHRIIQATGLQLALKFGSAWRLPAEAYEGAV